MIRLAKRFARRIVHRLSHRCGYRGLHDWVALPADRPGYRLLSPPPPGWYLLSLRLDAEQSRCYALCNQAQGRILPQARLRRRVLRIGRRSNGLELRLLGVNGSCRLTELRLAPLLPGRLRWLLARKLRRLHPGYAVADRQRRSFTRQWRDYNRLLARRSGALLLYDDWLERLERPALERLRGRLESAPGPTPPLAVLPWLLPDPQAAPAAAAGLDRQWPGGWHLLSRSAAGPAAETTSPHWVLPLAAVDRLAPQALHRFAQALRGHPQALVFYADEDCISAGGRRHSPRFRPAWNPDLLLSDPEFSHCWLIRSDVWHRAVAALEAAGQPLSLHALVLEATAACGPEAIVHLPEILLHRGGNGGDDTSAISATAASAAAVEGFLRRRGERVRVEPRPGGGHRLHWPLPRQAPLVSVIIPTRDRLDLLQRCLDSLQRCSGHAPPCEWLVIDNDSREAETLDYLASLERRPHTRVLRRPGPFNYAALNNGAALLAHGEVLAFLNNDVEAIEPGWLREMVAQALRPGIGAVGARLLYPDGTVQHAGVVLGIGGVAGHAHKYLPGDAAGHALRLQLSHNVSAVTGAALVIRRDRFAAVGGFDAAAFAVNYNDVDLCLRLMRAGYRNLYCSDAVLTHHESRSRGVPSSGPALEQWQRERGLMLQRWGALLAADPHYSPHLSLQEENFSLALREALPAARSGAPFPALG